MVTSNDPSSDFGGAVGHNDASNARSRADLPRKSNQHSGTQSEAGASAKIPLVVVHPNSVVQVGLQHAWSTSSFVRVCAVGASWSEVSQNQDARTAEIGILGLPAQFDIRIDEHRREIDALVGKNSHLKWIVLANRPSNACQTWALQAGVQGYVDGDYSAERLESMVVWVHAGRRLGFDQSHRENDSEDDRDPTRGTTSRLVQQKRSVPVEAESVASEQLQDQHRVEAAHDPHSTKPSALHRLKTLSRREREVLDGLAAGMTNQQIASSLFLSVKTVETYRSRLRQKLNLKDRADMVAIVRQDS